MEHINNDSDIINAINTPDLSLDNRPILDPDVPQERLESVYGQMADIVLQVSKYPFPEIGCISKANEDDEFIDTWIVKHRPLAFNTNGLVQVGGVQPHQLLQHTFQTA